MFEKIKEKISDISALDPIILIGVGLVSLLFSNLVPYVAAAAIAYGAYKLFL